MKLQYILSALFAGAANARLIGRQVQTVGSIDRWNDHQCDALGPGLGCHVREQGDVSLDTCTQTTDIDHFGACKGSASISAITPGCSSKI